MTEIGYKGNTEPDARLVARNFDAEACDQLSRYVSGVISVCPSIARDVGPYPTKTETSERVGLVNMGDIQGC
ncbi:MAG TPA: hypothetical protein VJB05_01075 [archaeon]|nr:hypothetical protein [archaeon]